MKEQDNAEAYKDNYVSDAYQIIIWCSKCGAVNQEEHDDKVFNNDCTDENIIYAIGQ
jgi:hypothetical protein